MAHNTSDEATNGADSNSLAVNNNGRHRPPAGVSPPNENETKATFHQENHTLPHLTAEPSEAPLEQEGHYAPNSSTRTLNGDLSAHVVGLSTSPTAICGNIPDEQQGDFEPFPGLQPGLLGDNFEEPAFRRNADLVTNDSNNAFQFGAPPSNAASEEHQIQAFAKLEFDDGEFYMNTYAVELGRDIRAARLALANGLLVSEPKSKKQNAVDGSASVKSEVIGNGESRNLSNSVISESGGVIGLDPPASDNDQKMRRKRSKHRRSKSSRSSSSQLLSRRSSMQIPNLNYNALAMASLVDQTYGLYDQATEHYMPSPDVTPLIPIHPPKMMEGEYNAHRSISRKHIRIAFNFEHHLFEVEIIGRNGGFVDDEWYAPGEIQPLVNGSVIQIGGVGVRFVLPDVLAGETGADFGEGSEALTDEINSFEMADSIVGKDGDGLEESTNGAVKDKKENSGDDENRKTNGRMRNKPKVDLESPKAKRKGPGRPPKNGISSKREQALLQRQVREEGKSTTQRKGDDLPGRGKGKTSKAIELEESSLRPSGKRKYTKRKKAGADTGGHVRESAERTDSAPPEQAIAAEAPTKPPKEKKPPKPPRSPSPVYDESTLTEEQLAKPQASYVILIHEALSNSKVRGMSLPQIYRAIERKYLYFKFRVTTLGWQSSVRHNLSQHAAFRKLERDGKGWLWGLVPEVSIEKEKKRRVTPPPSIPPQRFYPQPPQLMQHVYPYPGVTHSNGHMPQYPYAMPPGIPPSRIPSTLGPGRFPLPLANAQAESTYRSPYGSTSQAQNFPVAVSEYSKEDSNSRPHPALPTSQSQQFNGDNNRKYSELGDTEDGSHGPEVMATIDKFKVAFINEMDDKVNAKDIVDVAINEALHGYHSSSPSSQFSQNAIIPALVDMINNIKAKKDEKRAPNPLSRPLGSEDMEDNAEERQRFVAELAADLAKKIPLSEARNTSLEPGRNPIGECSPQRKRALGELENDDATDVGPPETKRAAT